MRQAIRNLLLVGVFFALNSLVAKGQKAESVLWKISGKHLPQNSYLLGTFHNAPYRLFADFPELKLLMRQCEFGILEKDSNPIGKVEQVAIVTPSLDSIFTPREYALVDSFFINSPYGSIRPHNAEASPGAMLQVVLMLKHKDTRKQEMQFDEYISYFLSDSLKRKTFGLDESAQMAKDAAKTNYRAIAKMIVFAIAHDVNADDVMPKSVFDHRLYVASLTSDMKLKQALGNTEMEQKIKELTLERNQLWLPKIVAKIQDGPCFIAVGLGHLQYQTGIIQLLRREGYTLQPVKLKKARAVTAIAPKRRG